MLRAVSGDIAQEGVDVIVNAANTTLLGGGGVDGAIHRAAGPALLEECRALGGCPTGQAKVTKGHRLGARWVVHAVGPVWKGGARGEDELLACCYRNALRLALELGAKSVAFPAISTGAYAFPPDRAAAIAVREVRDFLQVAGELEVRFVCFDAETLGIYERLLQAWE
ncbi:O-acetyl-ADP-ribose deacetylase [bacterium]|nr:MAG: O-acetyl-ADP-ribose deacetylase [bacterium]